MSQPTSGADHLPAAATASNARILSSAANGISEFIVANGADAIIVSNHGGRQLDGAPSTIRVLPEIMDAVGDKVEVYLDGGIRSGQDVLKALALGAKSTFIGRPMLYGLGAGGEAGVTRVLEIIRRELDTTMALCGERDILNVGLHNIYSNDIPPRNAPKARA